MLNNDDNVIIRNMTSVKWCQELEQKTKHVGCLSVASRGHLPSSSTAPTTGKYLFLQLLFFFLFLFCYPTMSQFISVYMGRTHIYNGHPRNKSQNGIFL